MRCRKRRKAIVIDEFSCYKKICSNNPLRYVVNTTKHLSARRVFWSAAAFALSHPGAMLVPALLRLVPPVLILALPFLGGESVWIGLGLVGWFAWFFGLDPYTRMLATAWGEAVMSRFEKQPQESIRARWADIASLRKSLLHNLFKYLPKVVVAGLQYLGICLLAQAPISCVEIQRAMSAARGVVVSADLGPAWWVYALVVGLPANLYAAWLLLQPSLEMWMVPMLIHRGEKVDDAINASKTFARGRKWFMVCVWAFAMIPWAVWSAATMGCTLIWSEADIFGGGTPAISSLVGVTGVLYLLCACVGYQILALLPAFIARAHGLGDASLEVDDINAVV